TLENKEQRDSLQRHLKEHGIPSMVYYPRPLHTQTVFADSGQEPSLFPNSRKAAETVLSLPMHPYLDRGRIEIISGIVENLRLIVNG
ncbi:MAG: aminotransferase DegT, partial [Clostridiaceae bacterium]|nr:aminotransferase DegT [Clostridiaceae bacterium]